MIPQRQCQVLYQKLLETKRGQASTDGVRRYPVRRQLLMSNVQAGYVRNAMVDIYRWSAP